MTFEESLNTGKIGESLIAKYFMSKKYNILPVYENTDAFKGPTVFDADGSQFVSPDMIVFNKDKIFWIEAKHKTAFSWYRKSKRWTTGIDIKHYKDYLKVNNMVSFELWLLFLHKDGEAKDTPPGMTSPTGLYGNNINTLSKNIDHKSDRHGNSGMVYWCIDNLLKIETYENILNLNCKTT